MDVGVWFFFLTQSSRVAEGWRSFLTGLTGLTGFGDEYR